jgi:hypothetical protein
MAMHGLLKQAAGTIRKFSVGALLALALLTFLLSLMIVKLTL